jgi:hypothetical protein
MIKILPSIILTIGLLSCSKTEKEQSIATADSSRILKVDSVRAAKTDMDDYEASLIYSNSDSDSLLLDDLDMKNLISLFKTKGSKIQDKEYAGGDCGGKFIRLIYAGDTLTIDKYSCGDYGFGNRQYLTSDDSLKLVRNYKMEWSAQTEKMEFTVTEKIYEFGIGKATISERMKVIDGWRNFDFVNIPFVTTTSAGQTDYMDLKKEQKELLTHEVLE